MKFYHYTDASGHAEIKRTKVIRCSRRGQQIDGIFGEYVYLTSLDPHEHDKEEIAKNNWNNGWEGNLNLGKTDYYFEIDIPPSDRNLRKVNSGDGRDIYAYMADLLHLDDFDWTSGKNSEWTPPQIVGAVLGGVAVAAGIGMLLGSFFSSNDTDDESKKKRDNTNRRF